MISLTDNIKLALIIEQIKQINENVIIEIIDNVITVTNCNENYISYLVILFGKVVVK